MSRPSSASSPLRRPRLGRPSSVDMPGTLGWLSEALAIGGLVALVALLVSVIA